MDDGMKSVKEAQDEILELLEGGAAGKWNDQRWVEGLGFKNISVYTILF